MSQLQNSRSRRGEGQVNEARQSFFTLAGLFGSAKSDFWRAWYTPIPTPRLADDAGEELLFCASALPRPQCQRTDYQDPEHQMRHHFDRSAHTHSPSAILVLKPTVDPFRGRPFPKTPPLRWIQEPRRDPLWVRLNQRHMAQSARKLPDRRRIISTVHQIIQRANPLGGHLRQRDGDLRIMHAGAAQERAHRNVSINNIQMQFVAHPNLEIAFAARLAPEVTAPGQIRQILRQTASFLLFDFAQRHWSRTSPFLGRPILRGGGGSRFGLGAGCSRTSMAVESRLTWPTNLGPHRALISAS